MRANLLLPWPTLGLALFLAALVATISSTQSQIIPELAFSRILHGWTNYSTAFLATYDTSSSLDSATVACAYTPLCHVHPVEFAAVFIWTGPTNQRPAFEHFTFEVGLWSGLEALVHTPRHGDLASVTLMPSGTDSLNLPDAFTRGGRPAWLLHFSLVQLPAPFQLPAHHPCYVGVTTFTDVAAFGELYVPTSPFRGISDVQAGNFIIGGWRELAESGGQTIYSGQLATELAVETVSPSPRLTIEPGIDFMQLSWPANAGCYHLETTDALGAPTSWVPVSTPPVLMEEFYSVQLPMETSAQWFRLTK